MGEIPRYRTDVKHDEYGPYGHATLVTCDGGQLVMYVDHLADKAAALAEKDEEIEKLLIVGKSLRDGLEWHQHGRKERPGGTRNNPVCEWDALLAERGEDG